MSYFFIVFKFESNFYYTDPASDRRACSPALRSSIGRLCVSQNEMNSVRLTEHSLSFTASRGRLGPDVSGVNLFFSHVPSQMRVAVPIAAAPSVHTVPLMHVWMVLIKPHPTI